MPVMGMHHNRDIHMSPLAHVSRSTHLAYLARPQIRDHPSTMTPKVVMETRGVSMDLSPEVYLMSVDEMSYIP